MDFRMNALKSRRGFLLTVSVLLIVIFALFFSQQFLQKSEGLSKAGSQVKGLERTAYSAELLSLEAAKIIGTRASITSGSESGTAEVTVSDSFPCGKNIQKLSEFRQIAEGDFAGLTNSEISADFSRLLDGKSELIFSNGLYFECSYAPSGQHAEIYSVNDASVPERIEITMDSNGSMNDVNAWQWDPSGDLEVSIDYTDSTIAVRASGRIDSSEQSVYSFNYSGGSIRIIAGEIGGRKGSVKIEKDNGLELDSSLSIKAILPSEGLFESHFDSEITVKQLGFEKTSRLRPLGS